jgi:sporulation protein YlmC with PRC-barrel domain
MDIPIDADVQCVDGSIGRSTQIIVNPVLEKVTHVVVQEGLLGTERLVPIDVITEARPGLIRLRLSKEQLGQLPPFTRTQYIELWQPYQNYTTGQVMLWPYASPASSAVAVDEKQIPPDELVIHRGTQVEARDGHVGQVSEFLVNPVTGHITHLVLKEGMLWNKKAVTIPASQIDRIEKDTVYLKLDKAAVEALPSIPMQSGPFNNAAPTG